MKLTPSGFYETPRVVKGFEFLNVLRDAFDHRKKVYVQFDTNEESKRIISYINPCDSLSDRSILFQVGGGIWDSVLLEDIEDFEFIQYRPQTEWKVINMSNVKRININEFEEIWLNDTFRKLTPVVVLHQCKFWHVMGLELANDDEDAVWYIYLKRQENDIMTRIQMPRTQKFIYNEISNSWSLEETTEEITDLERIKQALRAESLIEVTVSGVLMKLIRVQEVAKGILFFVFQDEEDRKRYYYARRGTKLRVVTDPNTLKKEYLLDHVKAMHID